MSKVQYVLCGAFLFGLAASAWTDLHKWKPSIDWNIAAPEITKAFPNDVFINYVPTDTYPIWFSCRHFVIPDNYDRIERFSGLFAQVGSGGTISGQETEHQGNARLIVDSKYKRKSIVIANAHIEIFNFRRIDKNDIMKDKIVLAMIGPASDKEMYERLLYSYFIPYKWLLLNSYFRANKQRIKEGLPAADAFVTDSCDAPATGLLELEELSKGAVRFFILENSK